MLSVRKARRHVTFACERNPCTVLKAIVKTVTPSLETRLLFKSWSHQQASSVARFNFLFFRAVKKSGAR